MVISGSHPRWSHGGCNWGWRSRASPLDGFQLPGKITSLDHPSRSQTKCVHVTCVHCTQAYLLSWENVRILRTASVLFFELAMLVHVQFRGKSQNIAHVPFFHVLFSTFFLTIRSGYRRHHLWDVRIHRLLPLFHQDVASSAFSWEEATVVPVWQKLYQAI